MKRKSQIKKRSAAAAVVAVVVPKSRPDALAAGLLAVLLLREVGWAWFPPELQGMASKGLGALLVLSLLGAVWHLAGLLSVRSGWLLAGVAYGTWSALQTLLCSLAYMAAPWDVPPGVGICSARIDLDLGALGLMFAAWFAVCATHVRVSR